MNTFAQAVESRTVTVDGKAVDRNLLKPVVDLFFQAGASRGKDIRPLLAEAFDAFPELTTRLGLWLRDVRGGAGERQLFRDFLRFMESHSEKSKSILWYYVMNAIPEFGRYDDYFEFQDKGFLNYGFQRVCEALVNPETSGLAAKWSPREKSSKKEIATQFRKYLGMSPKEYRKMLSDLTNVVESKMCAKQWAEINFSHVPSVAAARYQKAFNRNAPNEYAAYKESLVKGESKVNASAIFPYDVLTSVRNGDIVVAEAQWSALPDYVGEAKILPMIDVSGSMFCPANGVNGVTCMDVAVSLGMYIAEKQKGAFNGLYLTFTNIPLLQKLKGKTVLGRYNEITTNVGYDTNLDKAFEAVIQTAVKGKVPQEEMPQYILVMSDMQFNGKSFHWNDDLKNKIDELFAEHGYKTPNLIWWNLNASYGRVPVSPDVEGVGLVSGASPSVVKSVLSAKSVTPADIMLETLNSERYLKFVP